MATPPMSQANELHYSNLVPRAFSLAWEKALGKGLSLLFMNGLHKVSLSYYFIFERIMCVLVAF